MSSSTSSSRPTSAACARSRELGSLPGDPLPVIVVLGGQPEVALARFLELLFQPADRLARPARPAGRCAPLNSACVSPLREEGSWDISVDAMSAPSALRPAAAAGSVVPPGVRSRSTSSAYSPLTLRLSVTCDLAWFESQPEDNSSPVPRMRRQSGRMEGRGRRVSGSADGGPAAASAACAARARMLWRSPGIWIRRVAAASPSASANHTVPTGLASLPPPGPAIPVTATAEVHAQPLGARPAPSRGPPPRLRRRLALDQRRVDAEQLVLSSLA